MLYKFYLDFDNFNVGRHESHSFEPIFELLQKIRFFFLFGIFSTNLSILLDIGLFNVNRSVKNLRNYLSSESTLWP